MKKIKNEFFKKIVYYFFIFSIFLLFFNKTYSKTILDINEEDFIIGDINAPVTIIEYASLSCSHCANFHHNTLPQLQKEYIDTGIIKIVFRDFPLNYPALMGSLLLQCIDHNIRFEYLSALFILQPKWVKPEVEIVKKELFKIMQTGGMTKENFNKCLNNTDLEQKILQGLMDAQNEFNIGTTPSFIINGTLLKGNQSIKDFRKTINKALVSSND